LDFLDFMLKRNIGKFISNLIFCENQIEYFSLFDSFIFKLPKIRGFILVDFDVLNL
jgi:hypothetical protein